jgi:hypothetical protein
MMDKKIKECCIGCGESAKTHYKWDGADGWSFRAVVCRRCLGDPDKLQEIRRKVRI